MAENRESRKAKVIEVLNKARAMELFAIHQYMNQHYNLDDMDYGELAANMKLIAIDEMRHAEPLAPGLAVIVEIDTDDHVRAREPQPLQHVEADAAETEDHGRRTDLDLRGVDDRADVVERVAERPRCDVVSIVA